MLFKLEYLAECTLKGLVFKGEKHNLLVNICKGNRVGQQEKLVVCAARELHQPVFKLIQSLDLKQIGYFIFWRKVYVPNVTDLQ